MKIAVWDTYVKREDSRLMHFDVLVPEDLTDTSRIFDYANQYLDGKDFKVELVDSNRCLFCHMEQANSEVLSIIEEQGFFILELENCA